MLSSFSITNFKSYRQATLELAPLTVLIGANAAGKSNVVEALRLLSWIAAGNRLASIRLALQEKDHAIRGNLSDLGFRPERAFSLACRTDASDWDNYTIRLEVRDDDELHIADERLTGTGRASFARSSKSQRLRGEPLAICPSPTTTLRAAAESRKSLAATRWPCSVNS